MHAPSEAIDGILGEARAQLQERKHRLGAVISQARAEIREIDKALKRLGQPRHEPAKPQPSGNGKLTVNPGETRERVLAALRGSLEPLTVAEIAEQTDTSPSRIAATLRYARGDDLVVKVGRRWGLPANVDTETTSGALAD